MTNRPDFSCSTLTESIQYWILFWTGGVPMQHRATGGALGRNGGDLGGALGSKRGRLGGASGGALAAQRRRFFTPTQTHFGPQPSTSSNLTTRSLTFIPLPTLF